MNTREALKNTTEAKKPNYALRKFGAFALASGLLIGTPAAIDIFGPKTEQAHVAESLKAGNGPDTLLDAALADLEKQGVTLNAADNYTIAEARGEINRLIMADGIADPGETVNVTAERSPLLHRLELKVTDPKADD